MTPNTALDTPPDCVAGPGSAGPVRWLPTIASPPALLLAGICVAIVTALAVARLSGAPAVVHLVLQALLVLALGVLTLRDYRLAVTLALIELATAGAGGRWTVFPGGISGRLIVDAIVFAGAIRLLLQSWRSTGRIELGRYGPHALLVTVLLMAVWVPLGLIYGNGLTDVVSDGNGYAFIAFLVVFVVVLQQGHGRWIRDSIFVACAVNGLFLFAVLLLALAGITPLFPTVRDALMSGLGFEGAVGYMPSGAWRLYLPSALYLQVGMVLVGWRLLRSSAPWLWALYAVLMVDLALSYTRGLWICTAMALGIILVFGARELRPAFKLTGGTVGIFLLVSVLGLAVGFSVPDYLLDRASSTLSTRPIPPGYEVSPTPGTSARPSPTPAVALPSGQPNADELGSIGNQVRVEQARVLMGHILDRPWLGSGFGAIAPDYRYGIISRYEISFLDLAYKTGLIGTLIFLSLPLRLLWDCVRVRIGKLRPAPGVSRAEASVPLAIIASVLAVSVTNPYLFAAYGLLPILVSVAWLDPVRRDPDAETPSAPGG